MLLAFNVSLDFHLIGLAYPVILLTASMSIMDKTGSFVKLAGNCLSHYPVHRSLAKANPGNSGIWLGLS